MYQAIIQVLRYYAFFSYPPTEDELYVFLPRKTSRAHFHTALESLVKKDILLHKNIEGTVRYQILRNEQIFDIYTLKQKRGQTQYMKAQSILKYFHCIPTLKYLGISGSLSMLNIGNKSDIDIFVEAKETILNLIILMIKLLVSAQTKQLLFRTLIM